MKILFTKKRSNHPSPVSDEFNGGFTLAEMLMVLAIFAILTTVVLFQYGNFNSQTIMTNTAYEVALATRQAQVYALGVRNEVGDENFDNRYGVYINKTADDGGKSFIFFIDEDAVNNPDDPGTGICEDGGDNCFACQSSGECLEKYSITRDIYIHSICVADDDTPLEDASGACDEEISEIAITFERPNPDAIIIDQATGDEYNSAAIILRTQYGDQRAVIVKSTGNISVETLDDAS